MREEIPYIDQYFGVWSIAIERVRPLLSRWEEIQRIGIDLHLQSPEAIAARESGEVVQQSGRESFSRFSFNNQIADLGLHGTLMKQASSFDHSTSRNKSPKTNPLWTKRKGRPSLGYHPSA